MVRVTGAEPGYQRGDVPQPTDRVRIELRGHRFAYVVRVERSASGPRLAELALIPTRDGAVIDAAALRRIPTQRLAVAAARWLDQAGGLFTSAGELDPDYDTRPEIATRRRQRLNDELLQRVADTVRHAVAAGHPVRSWSAAQLHTTPGTLDRWIRAAKDHDFLSEDEVPRTRRSRSAPE